MSCQARREIRVLFQTSPVYEIGLAVNVGLPPGVPYEGIDLIQCGRHCISRRGEKQPECAASFWAQGQPVSVRACTRDTLQTVSDAVAICRQLRASEPPD